MHAHGTCITFTSAELLVLLLVLRLVLQVRRLLQWGSSAAFSIQGSCEVR